MFWICIRFTLFYNSDILSKKAENKKSNSALIRLEDITAEQRYATSESLGKLRIIADHLYNQNVPFHVAWIPRYVNPAKIIDNDPSTQLSMYNADFIFTLDYFIDKNGLIGLHGYTQPYDCNIKYFEFPQVNLRLSTPY